MAKRFLVLFLLLYLASIAHAAQSKNIIMIIAHHDFRDEELLVPKKIFEQNGFSVTIASTSLKTATGMLGAKVKPQVLINNVNVKNYDAVIFVGGVGSSEYFNNKTAFKIAIEATKEGKVIGATCLAPVILANAGILKGKKATVWPQESSALKQMGAIYTGKDVTVDHNIVTANGPSAASLFAHRVLELLKGNGK